MQLRALTQELHAQKQAYTSGISQLTQRVDLMHASFKRWQAITLVPAPPLTLAPTPTPPLTQCTRWQAELSGLPWESAEPMPTHSYPAQLQLAHTAGGAAIGAAGGAAGGSPPRAWEGQLQALTASISSYGNTPRRVAGGGDEEFNKLIAADYGGLSGGGGVAGAGGGEGGECTGAAIHAELMAAAPRSTTSMAAAMSPVVARGAVATMGSGGAAAPPPSSAAAAPPAAEQSEAGEAARKRSCATASGGAAQANAVDELHWLDSSDASLARFRRPPPRPLVSESATVD